MSRAPFLTAAEAAELDLLKLSRQGPVHFMGICGAGMSALAEYVARAGGQATGCDGKPASDVYLATVSLEVVPHSETRT